MKGCTVGGVTLPHGPYMIGAGACKTPALTKMWLKVAPAVSGSYTPDGGSGNPGNVLFPDTLEELISLGAGNNSLGMPNMGYAHAKAELASIEAKQPMIVSIAGFKPADYWLGVETFQTMKNVAAIELNKGCPNKQEEHTGDIMSFDPIAVRQTLEGLSARGVTKPLWLKFSPYSNPNELMRMAFIVNEFRHELNLTVVTCNTFANSYMPKAKLTPNKGRAGLSGPAMKYIALGQVHQFREYLDPIIDVVSSGGHMTGDDIMDSLEAGAKAVELTSLAYWGGTPDVFFEHLMNQETSSRFIKHLTDDI